MLSILDVPARFQPQFPFPYPGHQVGPLLEEFVHADCVNHLDEWSDFADWTYLPIYWTSYAAIRPRVRGLRRILGHPSDRDLNRFLAAQLRPGVRYFTVSQHDDGLRQRGRCQLPQPVLEFSAGGVGDIPIPLLCDPHPVMKVPRDIRASFLGLLRDTPIPYPCRTGMVEALESHGEYHIEHAGNDFGDRDPARLASKQRRFTELMCRSVFALCPRGYGKTSFRLYESIQLGAIPVYIYDEPWLPYRDVLDWDEFAILVPLAEVGELHNILASQSAAEIARKQSRLREVHSEFFTFPAVCRQIRRMLRTRSETTEGALLIAGR